VLLDSPLVVVARDPFVTFLTPLALRFRRPVSGLYS
jgi:hypothetical protein